MTFIVATNVIASRPPNADRLECRTLVPIVLSTPYTVHNHRMDLFREKKAGTRHSDFLMKLKEMCNLIEYDKMTGPAFGTFSWRKPTPPFKRLPQHPRKQARGQH